MAGVCPPRLGQPVALVFQLLPRPLPQHVRNCHAGKEEGSGESLRIGWAWVELDDEGVGDGGGVSCVIAVLIASSTMVEVEGDPGAEG